MKRYLICSGKGGVGKSMTTCQLAVTMRRRGHAVGVLVTDCDVGLRALDLLTGLGQSAVYTWQDVLSGNCTLSDAILTDPAGRLSLLMPPAALDGPLSAEAFSAMLEKAAADFDFCFLDAGAGVDGIVPTLASVSDAALVVATPDSVSARAAAKTAEMLWQTLPPERLRLLLNRYSVSAVRDGVNLSTDDMIDETGVRFLGAVPEDAGLHVLPCGKDMSSRTATAFNRIAARLLDEPVPFSVRKL